MLLEAPNFGDILSGPITLLRPVIDFLLWIEPILIIYSLIMLIIMVELNIRLRRVRRLEYERIGPLHSPAQEYSKQREQFEKITDHVNSSNSAEWRVAILDADNMLDDLIASLGYPGDNLGERLRAVDKSDFLTLDAAWEAHKVRNRIAHEGKEYNLSQREAREVVGKYEKVFKEFNYL